MIPSSVARSRAASEGPRRQVRALHGQGPAARGQPLREVGRRFRPERGPEPLVGPLMRTKLLADLLVLRGGGLEREAAIEAERHEQRPAAARRGERVKPGGRGQVEQRRSGHAGELGIVTQPLACEVAKAERDHDLTGGSSKDQIRPIEAGHPAAVARPAVQRLRRGIEERPGRCPRSANGAGPRSSARRVAKIGADAAAEVDDARDDAKRRGEARGELGAAGHVVGRLARGQPVDGEVAQPGITRHGRRASRRTAASRRPSWAGYRAPPAHRRFRQSRAQLRLGDHLAQRLARAPAASPGGTRRPASSGTVSGIAPALVEHHRQAAGERLGQHHAVAFVVRRAARTDRPRS